MRAAIATALETLSALYEDYQANLSSDLSAAVHSQQRTPAVFKTVVQSRLNRFVEKFSREFETAMQALIAQSVSETLQGNHMQRLALEESALLGEYVDDRAAQSRDAILAQAQKDALVVIGSYQRFLLSVIGASNIDAAMRAERERMYSLDLAYRDRLGRSWSSVRFVQVELETVAYELVNLVAVYALIQSGDDTAFYDKPGSDKDGLVIELDKFDELQTELFYPGSQALVVN